MYLYNLTQTSRAFKRRNCDDKLGLLNRATVIIRWGFKTFDSYCSHSMHVYIYIDVDV